MTPFMILGTNVNSVAERTIARELVKAKREVGSQARQRLDAYDRAAAMLPWVELARAEIEDARPEHFKDGVSDNAIARWLNLNHEGRGVPRAAQGGEWGRKTVRAVLMDVDQRVIAHAVLECRTRMTATALRADFTKSLDKVEALEREYLDYIADAIDLGHRLRGDRQRERGELLAEARVAAIEEAARQRSRKPISMMARERLWTGRATIERKVFAD